MPIRYVVRNVQRSPTATHVIVTGSSTSHTSHCHTDMHAWKLVSRTRHRLNRTRRAAAYTSLVNTSLTHICSTFKY